MKPPTKATATTPGNRKRIAFGIPVSLPSAESISFWSNWILIGALIIGVVATYGIVVSGNVKESAANREIARLSADAEASRAAIADANARALEAQVALEKFKAPRTLNPEQMERIIGKLPLFEGGSIDIGASTTAFEPMSLTEQIFRMLLAAHIPTRVNHGFAASSFGAVIGIAIQHVTGNEAGTRMAEALALAMNGEHIAATVTGGMFELAFTNPALERNSADNRRVLIAVGEKPAT